MTLFGEVLRLTDDVVATILNSGDQRGTLGIWHQFHPVANSHGIGTADALQAEVAFHLRINQLAIVGQDGVPAASILNNKTFQGFIRS